MKSRGLSGEIAKEFSIGYAPEGWQNLETAFKSYQDQTLINAGLIQKNEQGRYYDRFRDRIMFPIHNAKGIVIGFGGRVINPEDTPKYYNSPETALFQKSYELYGLLAARKAIRDNGYVIVVEGYMDVIGLGKNGIEKIVELELSSEEKKDFDNSIAFNASLDLIIEGTVSPSGYTEPILHKRRIELKSMLD